MEHRSTAQLQAEQAALVKIEFEIKQILPKLQEFENILKVEEMQLKANLLSATLGNTQQQTQSKEKLSSASSLTAFDLAKNTAVAEDEFEVNQQDIILDMVAKSIGVEEEEDDIAWDG